MTREELEATLRLLGHSEPEKIIDAAQRTVDALAKAEAEGVEWENVEWPAADLAEDFQIYFPAVWEFACAGHHGGGSGSTDGLTDQDLGRILADVQNFDEGKASK